VAAAQPVTGPQGPAPLQWPVALRAQVPKPSLLEDKVDRAERVPAGLPNTAAEGVEAGEVRLVPGLVPGGVLFTELAVEAEAEQLPPGRDKCKARVEGPVILTRPAQRPTVAQ
jgi:hypothetical protein